MFLDQYAPGRFRVARLPQARHPTGFACGRAGPCRQGERPGPGGPESPGLLDAGSQQHPARHCLPFQVSPARRKVLDRGANGPGLLEPRGPGGVVTGGTVGAEQFARQPRRAVWIPAEPADDARQGHLDVPCVGPADRQGAGGQRLHPAGESHRGELAAGNGMGLVAGHGQAYEGPQCRSVLDGNIGKPAARCVVVFRPVAQDPHRRTAADIP